MKWISHQIVTGSVIYLATDSLLLTACGMAGALLHILEDALCGEVPLIFPGEKIGLKLFKVGSFTEYFFAAGLILLAYGLRLAGGG